MREQKIKVIIFDLDGTLIDAYRAIHASVNLALKKMGYQNISYVKVRRHVGWGERELMEALVASEDVNQLIRCYRQTNRASIEKHIRFLPGARKLIKELKRKQYKLAVATNRPAYSARFTLNNLGIKKYFDSIVCADHRTRPKPAPDMIRRILKRHRCQPSHALYVGDMALDVRTGRRAGVKTIAVTTGSSTRKEIRVEKPDWLVSHIGKVSEIVEHYNQKS